MVEYIGHSTITLHGTQAETVQCSHVQLILQVYLPLHHVTHRDH